MSWRVSYQGVAQVPGDINTTDQEVVVDLATLVSEVVAAVATLASAVIGEDQAKLMVHPVVTPLVDQVQADSEDNRRIDIRNLARVAAVAIKTAVPEDSKEDMDTADVTVEGRSHTASNTKSSIRRVATITLNARAATVMSFKESTEFCCQIRGHRLFGIWLTT